MNIQEAKQFVNDTVKAYLAVDDDGLRLIGNVEQRPLFLVGPPGIGKTAIMAQVAAELGVGLVSYSMTHHTRQSALGLPVIQHRVHEGIEYDASEYTMSEIIASVYDYMEATGEKRGILFLDEINCVSETLYPSMLQFLQFKTFGKHAVPDGWVVVCAGNPPEYNRSVHEFDIVTLDRLRKLEVEPDYEVWKAYATGAGVHPSVTTFLETEKDCFYHVEATPRGKRFVTARAWADLSRMISVNERLGLPVSGALIGQFLQDADIAEKFSLYYDLFSKYKSDYQVPSILAGDAAPSVADRARAARFDERLALLGMMLDALMAKTADALVQESVLGGVRDVLRASKPDVLAGASAVEVLDSAIGKRKERLDELALTGVADERAEREAKREISLLQACRKACLDSGCETGPASFDAAHQEFRGHVGAFEREVADVRSQIEHAFGFIEDVFGEDREALLFTTELMAHRPTALFVSKFGCEAFMRHSENLQTSEREDDLARRIAQVRDEDEGLQLDGVAEGFDEDIDEYYRGACWEYGYASLCHMALPANLNGKMVLDVGCRRGKGVFKLSERVGQSGRVVGIDWVKEHIDEAKARMERAARDSGLASSNMEFHVAYPESLIEIGLGDNTVDVAFANSVLHLAYSPRAALEELYRVLKPGGLLVLEVALASAPRDPSVVEQARKLGNSIQAAPARDELLAYLGELGFDVSIAEQPQPVDASTGFKFDYAVPVAKSTEEVSFSACVLHAVKTGK